MLGLGRLRDLLGRLDRRARYRRDLRRLLEIGSHLIDDIGLSLDRARLEARKPVWRP